MSKLQKYLPIPICKYSDSIMSKPGAGAPSRRIVYQVSLTITLITLLFVCGCGQQSAKKQFPPPVERTWLTMGTFASLTLRGDNAQLMPQCLSQTKKCFENINQKLSTYIPTSEISIINTSTGTVEISHITADMIQTTLDYSNISNGAFDPTVSPLIRMWGFSGGTTPTNLPSPQVIASTLIKTGYKNIELRSYNQEPATSILITSATDISTYTLNSNGRSLDLGGIAKGFAVDRAYNKIIPRKAILQPQENNQHPTRLQRFAQQCGQASNIQHRIIRNPDHPEYPCKNNLPHLSHPKSICVHSCPSVVQPLQNSATSQQNPESNFLINLGGNIRCHGTATPLRPWCIGVRNPFDTNKTIGSLIMKSGMAIATSGNYERFVKIDGKRYAHIIDPRTGYPVQGMAGVTILSKTATEADALSTALFVAGLEGSQSILAKTPTTQAIIIPDKKPIEIWISPSLQSLFTPHDQYKNSIHLLTTP